MELERLTIRNEDFRYLPPGIKIYGNGPGEKVMRFILQSPTLGSLSVTDWDTFWWKPIFPPDGQGPLTARALFTVPVYYRWWEDAVLAALNPDRFLRKGVRIDGKDLFPSLSNIKKLAVYDLRRGLRGRMLEALVLEAKEKRLRDGIINDNENRP